jgi:hypothetical protein
LRAAVDAIGGPKVVGHMLWPASTVGSAHTSLLDALNRDRPAKLSPDQVIFILREARKRGHHEAMHWLCDSAGYAEPQPLALLDEAAELQRAFITATAGLSAMLQRLQTLGLAPTPGLDQTQEPPVPPRNDSAHTQQDYSHAAQARKRPYQ